MAPRLSHDIGAQERRPGRELQRIRLRKHDRKRSRSCGSDGGGGARCGAGGVADLDSGCKRNTSSDRCHNECGAVDARTHGCDGTWW